MTNRKIVHSAVMAALLTAGTFAVAQSQPRDPQNQPRPGTPSSTQTPPRTTQPSTTQQAKLDLRRVSELKGTAVMSSDNQKVGDIHALAIDLENGKTYFAIISSGGVMGMGDDLTPVPYKAVNFGTADQDARLTVTKDKFDAAAKINDQQWDRLNDTTWCEATYKHFNVQFKHDDKDQKSSPGTPNTPPRPSDRPGAAPGSTTPPASPGSTPGSDNPQTTTPGGTQPGATTPPSTAPRGNTPPGSQQAKNPGGKKQLNLVSSNDAIGLDVNNPQDEDLGEINDLVIDVRSGQIAYAVLGAGGVMGMGEELHAIPWQALRLDRENEQFVLNITKERLEAAPGFDDNNWPQFADATWSRDVHQYYGTDPDWIYGFADEDDDIDIDVDIDRDNRSGGSGNMQGWEPNSEYNRLYKAGETQTLTCTVTNVERTRFMPNMSEGVALHVNCNNQTQVVHLGPSSYIDDQNVEFKNNDQVTIKGVRATVNGKQVIMASEVQVSGKTIKLRDESGKPMWASGASTGAPSGGNRPTTPPPSPTSPR